MSPTKLIRESTEWTMHLLAPYWFNWDDRSEACLENISQAMAKSLKSKDDLMVDSSRSHMLFATPKGLYLISRKSAWKSLMTEADIELYSKKGPRAFVSIERAHKSTTI